MINQLVTHIQTHGGATLKASNLEHANLKSGYMVSILGHELKLDLDTIKLEDLQAFSKTAKALGGYVGAWLDNDILYLDISLRVSSKTVAHELGRLNKQLAIYDNKRQAVITL